MPGILCSSGPGKSPLLSNIRNLKRLAITIHSSSTLYTQWPSRVIHCISLQECIQCILTFSHPALCLLDLPMLCAHRDTDPQSMSLVSNQYVFFPPSGGNDISDQPIPSATLLRVPRPLIDTEAHVPITDAESIKNFLQTHFCALITFFQGNRLILFSQPQIIRYLGCF